MKLKPISDRFENPSTWIPIHSLKKAANLPTIIDTCHSDNTFIVDLTPEALWKGIDNFATPDNNKLSSISVETHAETSSQLDKSFKRNIAILNQEIAILSNQLQCSHQEIERLNRDLLEEKKQSIIKLQFMQEQHEKKMHKKGCELDFLLNDLAAKSAVIMSCGLISKHAIDIDKIKQKYKKKIGELKSLHQKDLDFREIEKQKEIEKLKRNFFAYLSQIENNFKNELSEVKRLYAEKLAIFQAEVKCPERHFTHSYDEFTDSFRFLAKISPTNNRNNESKESISSIFERLSCETNTSTRRESKP